MIEEFQSRGIVLWANGDRLGYRSPKGVLTKEDLAELRVRKEEVLARLRERDAIHHDEQARFEPFPMTDIQRAYATGQSSGYELGGTGCHSYVELLTPRLDRERLETAWHELIRRHDMLSAVVIPPDSLRVVPFEKGPVLEEIDLRGHDPRTPDEDYLRYRSELEDRRYPVGAWPLHEFRLLQFDGCSILQFSVDMIIADFVSVKVMTEELMSLYAGQQLAPVTEATFRDIIMTRSLRAATSAGSAEYESAKQYWTKAIEAMQDKPSLPVKHASSPADDEPVRFTRRRWRCAPEAWASFALRASGNSVTPSNVLLTAYTDVIRRWSSSGYFCVNVTLMSRDQTIEGVERIVGDFTQVVVHACHPQEGSFIDRVRATQKQLFDEISHAAFPGVEVLRELGRAKGAPAIVPIVFTGALGAGLRHDEGQAYELVHGVSRTPQVWIDCQAFEDDDMCNVNWDVRDGIIAPEILEDMWAAFTDMLDRLVTDEATWCQEQVVLLGPATQKTRERVHDTARERVARCLQDGFWDQVRRAPEALALVWGTTTYSYGQLAAHVEALQTELSGVGRGDRVAIVLGKGVWQVAATLAVVSAGAAYVPIDHDQPSARQHRLISVCRPAAIIADGAYSPSQGQPAVVNVDTLREGYWSGSVPESGPVEYTAYIIFTSGSTGTPKGVVMTHAAAMNTIDDVNNSLGRGAPRTVLALSRLSFDLSVYDIFGAFASGGTLVLPLESESRDPSRWIVLMAENHVDTWNTVPALFQMLLHEREATGQPPDLGMGLVLLSGDLIPRALPAAAAPQFPNAELISLGGATEGGIWSIFHPMTDHVADTNIPYGTALSNQGMWVLDEFGNECPDGVLGRIHISGDSLATEYFDDPEATAAKFYFSERRCIRVYDTGDIGSYRADGVIEFHGRADHQVKINGYRVETGEIEAVLESHDGVDRAVVIAHDVDGQKRLRAFVTPSAADGTGINSQGKGGPAGESLHAMLERLWAPADTSVDSATFAEWMRTGNEASLAALLAAFHGAGVFLVPDQHHDLTEMIEEIAPDDEYRELVGCWLRIMVAEGLVTSGPQGYAVTQYALDKFRVEERWDRFEELENQVHNSSVLFAYQRHAAKTLLGQLRGEVNPVDLFFPEGGIENARAIYGENRISEAINAAVAEAVVGIVSSHGDRPIRILEVGAGVGATTENVVERLPGNVVEYRFTDISNFFLRNARQNYRHQDFMTYGLFDVNVDCASQDVELGAYDLIICANVLHNAVNIKDAFARLNQLRRANGVIVMVEPVTELYAALISISIKMSLVAFTDHRADSHKVFIEDAEWDRVYEETGLRRLAEYPGADDPLRGCGQRLIVVGDADAPTIDEDDLFAHMRANLPGYMVPVSVRIMDDLPLSANGKVDRKALARPYESGNAVAVPKAVRPLSGLETQIAEVWKEVLEVSEIGRAEDFYAAGGDSLLMAEAVTRMRQVVPGLQDQTWDAIMREMLKHPTIAGIAEMARGGAPAARDDDAHADTSGHMEASAPMSALSTIANSSPNGSRCLHRYRVPERARNLSSLMRHVR
jgi:pyochelin synthetase